MNGSATVLPGRRGKICTVSLQKSVCSVSAGRRVLEFGFVVEYAVGREYE